MLPDSPFIKLAKENFFLYGEYFTVISDLLYGCVRQHIAVEEKRSDYQLLKDIAITRANKSGQSYCIFAPGQSLLFLSDSCSNKKALRERKADKFI